MERLTSLPNYDIGSDVSLSILIPTRACENYDGVNRFHARRIRDRRESWRIWFLPLFKEPFVIDEQKQRAETIACFFALGIRDRLAIFAPDELLTVADGAKTQHDENECAVDCFHFSLTD